MSAGTPLTLQEETAEVIAAGLKAILLLGDCIASHDACTRIKRAYGKAWPAEIDILRKLESEGLLRFVSIHRESGTGAMIRRSTITAAGLAKIGATRVLGMAPETVAR